MRMFTIGSLTQWMCLIVLGNSQPLTTYRPGDLDIHSFDDCCDAQEGCLTTGDPYFYRYIEPSIADSTKIYVGAMNFLFILNTTTMQCTKYKHIPPSADLKDRCIRQGKKDTPDCQNHIREVFEIGSQLEVCGTGAYQPQMYYLNINTLNVNSSESQQNTAPTCPYDPLDNSTLLFSKDNNPGETSAKYFGYYTDFTKNFPVFLRPKYTHNGVTYVEKLTDTEDVSWLNSPQFVGSFDIDNMVVIFFRETAVEYAEMNKKVYSRVAKVCKKDRGGGSIDVVRKKWLSFQKARLVCSLPGKQPYYFDDIYDVAYDSENKNFYALFYKQGADLNASAICVYNMTQIKTAFAGHFMHKNGTLVTPDPDPRLDNCTLHDTNPEIFQGKSSQYQLMSTKVQPVSGEPIFYKHGEQLLRLALSNSKGSFHNIYVGTSKGEIYDIFVNQVDWSSYINSVMMPFSSPRPIWKMMLKADALIVGTDLSVTKITLDDCNRINIGIRRQDEGVDECVLNTYCQLQICGNDRSCVSIKDDVQGNCISINASSIPTGTTVKQHILNTLNYQVETLEVNAFPDQYVELRVVYPVRLNQVQWKKDSDSSVLNDHSKYGFSGNNLIIKSLQLIDGGTYIAYDDEDTEVARTTLKISADDDDTIDAWKRSFKEWSVEFNRWKSCSNSYISSCGAP